ncbi:ATP-binding protein [Telmatospirillum sp.]|uniref:ATP-binding protein n=1 Tax=Telmatospirillum sp. TaxID=2079197 RepID=UPI00284DE70A|nr:ATP-binding protein [Telmatospirillum sp.]MDR3437757.1 ATP-binding protein [Telmatospirillum sp.]
MKPVLSRLLPDTLIGRTVLVLLLGLILLQLAGVALYSMNRLELTANLRGRQTAERIAGVVKLAQDAPDSDRGRILRAMELPGLRIGWGQAPLVGPEENDPDAAAVYDELTRRLTGVEVRLSLRPPPPLDPMAPPFLSGEPTFGHGPDRGPGMMRHPHPIFMRAAVHMADGSWLNFIAEFPNEDPLWRMRFLGPLTLGLMVVMVLSVLAVRRAAKPLALLAAAAQRLGRDVTAPPMPVVGPREVRAAAVAFNEMQTRLRRFVEDRTQMIAAISHDLRTPITRLKLRAEFVDDDEQRLKMLSDLDEMEEMIASTLAFARDDVAREVRRQVDLGEMLAELCADFDAQYHGPISLVITAGPTGLKRAFANLLENGLKYGGGAEVAVDVGDSHVEVVLSDSGPGIPEAELERVFAPFYRVESSRNRATGGTGLGLAVARSAIRAHGGDIVLVNRPEGGLKVTVTLPR